MWPPRRRYQTCTRGSLVTAWLERVTCPWASFRMCCRCHPTPDAAHYCAMRSILCGLLVTCIHVCLYDLLCYYMPVPIALCLCCTILFCTKSVCLCCTKSVSDVVHLQAIDNLISCERRGMNPTVYWDTRLFNYADNRWPPTGQQSC